MADDELMKLECLADGLAGEGRWVVADRLRTFIEEFKRLRDENEKLRAGDLVFRDGETWVRQSTVILD